MTNVLVVTEKFYPPWFNGIVSYSKGLVDSILETSKSRKNLMVTILSSRKNSQVPKLNPAHNLDFFYSSEEKYQMNLLKIVRTLSEAKNFDVTHLLLPRLNPLLIRIAENQRNIIFKHLFIYPFHIRFLTEKLVYRFFQNSGIFKVLNINLAFSSKALEQMYSFEEKAIFPPAVDTRLYSPKLESNSECREVNESTLKIGNINDVLHKDVVLLYMGPLLQERFHFKSIMDCFARLRQEYNLDAGLVIVGRELGTASDLYLEEVHRFITKYNLSGSVFACLKNLSEAEKIFLFRNTQIFIYPFQERLPEMSVVSPPIALLESMSVGQCVVSGGLAKLSDLIKNNENGVLINKTIDGRVLAESVWEGLVNKRKISINARSTIENNFSIQYVSKLYAHFLSSAGI